LTFVEKEQQVCRGVANLSFLTRACISSSIKKGLRRNRTELFHKHKLIKYKLNLFFSPRERRGRGLELANTVCLLLASTISVATPQTSRGMRLTVVQRLSSLPSVGQ
jgi:hypothetical protein